MSDGGSSPGLLRKKNLHKVPSHKCTHSEQEKRLTQVYASEGSSSDLHYQAAPELS